MGQIGSGLSLNPVIFPSPRQSYDEQFNNENKDFFKYQEYDRLIFISSKNYSTQKPHKLPCLFLPYIDKNTLKSTKNFLIFFHGNAEDLGNAYHIGNDLREYFDINVVIMEYPTYGVYKYHEIEEQQINQDAVCLMEELITKTGKQNIIIFGRSMGSGPACKLASKYLIKALILFSPFTSIKEAANSLVGFVSVLLKDRFRNIDIISQVKSPILLIHGKADNLIPYTHSQKLEKAITSTYFTHYSEKMTHNWYDTKHDLIDVLERFFDKILFKYESYIQVKIDLEQYNFPDYGENMNPNPKIKNQQQIEEFKLNN